MAYFYNQKGGKYLEHKRIHTHSPVGQLIFRVIQQLKGCITDEETVQN